MLLSEYIVDVTFLIETVESLFMSMNCYPCVFVNPNVNLSIVKFWSEFGKTDVNFQKHMFELFESESAFESLLTAVMERGIYKWAYRRMLERGLETTKDLVVSKEDVASIVNSMRNEVLMMTVFDEE